MRAFLPTILPLFWACESEKGVTIHNSEPTVTITSHTNGTLFLEGVEYTLIGQVSDQNHSNQELLVVWSTDERTLCPETPPNTNGETVCQTTLNPSETTIKIQVTDPDGAAAVTDITIEVQETEPPVVSILSPTTDASYYSDGLIAFSAIIGDAEDDTSDLSYQWESSVDGPLDITGAPESSGEIEGYLSLTEGQHAISLTVEDTSGKTTTESVVIEVGGENNAPDCEITAPESGTTFITGENITFEGIATDSDINNGLLSISWESDQDGVFNTAPADNDGNLSVMHNGMSAGNHVVSLRVMDEADGLCTQNINLTIGTPPTLTILAPTDGAVFSVGSAVSFEATASDAEDLPSDLSFSWHSDIDGEFSTQGADSNGTLSFSTADLTVGLHNLQITVTDTSGLTASASLSLRVNTPPPAPTISLQPDPLAASDDLTANVATDLDADGDSIAYTYSWYENGVSTSTTAPTVLAAELDVGEVWTVRVTPNDGYVDGDWSEASITVSNSQPSVDSVTISPSTNVSNDDVVSCTATTSDADETVTPTFVWLVGSSSYSGASLDLSNTTAMPTDVVTCTATVNDSHGGSDSMSTTVAIANRNPVVSGLSISPTPIYTYSSVSCGATIWDADEEIPSSSIDWSVGGVSIGSGDSLQLDNSMVAVNDSLACTLTATDGYGGTISDTTSVTISNTEPSISASIAANGSGNTAELTCSAVASDTDDSPVVPAITYAWFDANGAALGTSNPLQLDASMGGNGDDISCVATATDLSGGSASDTALYAIIVDSFSEHIVTTNNANPWTVVGVDMDGDGDTDVVSSSYDDSLIAWYENDGNQNFTEHSVTTLADAARDVAVADMDNDGDMDVLSAQANMVRWYENDGAQNFTVHTVAYPDAALAVQALDVDGDGDMDILSASNNGDEIAWYENDGNQNFSQAVIGSNGDYAVYAHDLDGDGDVDVLAADSDSNEIVWYENDGSENFTEYSITTDAMEAQDVRAIDLDGDGDMDVLSASAADDKIAWYENDGSENFTAHTITTNVDLVSSIYTADMNGDGYMDVLSSSRRDDKVALFLNDGASNFTEEEISTTAAWSMSVMAVDMDGDGDPDILSSSEGTNRIFWFEN